jgi:hypothetical protein
MFCCLIFLNKSRSLEMCICSCVDIFFATHVTLNSRPIMQRASFRCVILPRQHVRRCEQRYMYRLQFRHVLSGGNGYAVALPRRVLLPGDHQCDECAAPAVPHGVVLQCQRIGRRRALSSGLGVSHRRPVVGAGSMPDRIRVSHGRFGRRCAVSARSILPRDGLSDGCTVSVGPIQPRSGHELLRGVYPLCAGLVWIARPCWVHHCLPRWILP